MRHLNALRIINFLYAGLLFLAALVLGALGSHATGPDADIIPLGICFALLFAVLALVTGMRVGDGEGRGLQTVLAILSATSFPIGTAYAAYAIYVCWINDEARATFG